MHNICKSRQLVLTIVLLTLTWQVHAGPANDRDRLARLDEYIEQARLQWQVPGLAVAIVKDGEVVLAKGYGVRDVRGGQEVDQHTLFAIASNSKAFTAAALAILVDQGKLDWDDRVIDHLPYFQLYAPYVTHEMRIRDLLCHRSGLGTFSGDLLWYGTSYSAEEVIRRARFLKPASSFRSKYGYSNLMFIAAGEVVRAVSGQPWQDFVQTQIFDKLGMARTVTSVKRLEARDNVATPHREIDGVVKPLAWYGWDNMVAAGGIISSVHDMSKWLLLQLNRGSWQGTQIFSEQASRTMWSAHTVQPISKSSEKRFPSTHFRAYGLGWAMMDYQGRKVLQHGGGYDGMFSRVVLVPEENLGMVILTNAMTPVQTALAYRILDTYLGGEDRDWSREFYELAQENKKKKVAEREKREKQRVAGTTPSLPLASYAGTYGGEMYGDAEVKLENGKLVVQFLPNPDLVGDLTHWHFDTFAVKWRKQFAWFDDGKVQFILDQDGKVTEMKVDVPNDDFWFTELQFLRKSE